MGFETLEAAAYEALRRSLVDVGSLWREWERLGGLRRRGGAAIERLLNLLIPPERQPESSAEMKLLNLVRSAGLPEPAPQFRVRLSGTRGVRLDLAWPYRLVALEFNPYKYHGGRPRYLDDASGCAGVSRRGGPPAGAAAR